MKRLFIFASLWLFILQVTTFGQNHIYVLNSSSNNIVKANADGTSASVIYSGGLSNAGCIALDVANNRMYAANYGNNNVLRANLDGSSASFLTLSGLLSGPVGVAIDLMNGHLYVTSMENNKVIRSNLDGTGAVDLTALSGFLFEPSGIALDLIHNKLFIVNNNYKHSYPYAIVHNEGVVICDLDGSNPISTNLGGLIDEKPQDIALDLTNNKMYVSNSGTTSGNEIIIRANLDGSNPEDLGNLGGLLNNPGLPIGVALNVAGGKMIISNYNNTVDVANLDGTSAVSIGNFGGNLDYPFGIAWDGGSDGSAELPVELSSFNVLVNINSAKLVWSTATELNNFGFDVEIRSAKSGGWEKIGFVNGNGNSNSMKEYSYIDKTFREGTYYYRLKQFDNNGKYEYSKAIEASFTKPFAFNLEQNFPNPFNPTTLIEFSIPQSTGVTLKVFDVLGKEVESLVNDFREAGSYSVNVNAENLASGVYYYELHAGNYSEIKKMILLR